MFCIYCGKEIPDGTVCECRKNPVSVADTQKTPDRKSTRLNSSHDRQSRMPSSA